MSEKIKSKDLSYDSTLPPFLQRLHDKNAGRGDTDRHERQIARPRKPKDSNEDDGPTVVDATGETVSKEEYEKLTKANVDDDTANVTGKTDLDADPKASGALPAADGTSTNPDEKRTDSSVTDGISQKKRKAAKVVGEDEAGEEGKNDSVSATKTAKKVKKKAKVKLTFDDDEGS